MIRYFITLGVAFFILKKSRNLLRFAELNFSDHLHTQNDDLNKISYKFTKNLDQPNEVTLIDPYSQT